MLTGGAIASGESGHLIGRCGKKPNYPICVGRGLQADHRPGDPSKCEPVPPGVVCEDHERPRRERPASLSRPEQPGNSPGIRIRRHSDGWGPAGPLGRIPRSGPGGAEVIPASLDCAPSEEGCRAGGSPPKRDSSSPVDGRASRHSGRGFGGGVASSPNP